MSKIKISMKWCKYVLGDEKKAQRMYKKHGFPKISRQEGRHYNILKGACRGV